MLLLCKAVGALLIFGSSASAGFVYSASFRKKRLNAENMARYWRAFSQYLAAGTDTPAQIARMLAKCAEFQRFEFADALFHAAAKQPDFLMAIPAAERDCELTPALSISLEPLRQSIGRQELAFQQRVIGESLLGISREASYWQEKEKKQGLLVRRVGILGGVALVVILL